MARYSSADMPYLHRKHSCFYLALCWFWGLLCGAVFFQHSRPFALSLMRSAIGAPVSIVGLFCIGFLPFLFTAFAVYISQPRLLLLTCFCKACAFSFAFAGIYEAFGSAGWLLRILLLFSDSVYTLFLYCLWLRLLSGRQFRCFSDTVIYFLIAVWTCGVDYYIIAPFLAELIEI